MAGGGGGAHDRLAGNEPGQELQQRRWTQLLLFLLAEFELVAEPEFEFERQPQFLERFEPQSQLQQRQPQFRERFEPQFEFQRQELSIRERPELLVGFDFEGQQPPRI